MHISSLSSSESDPCGSGRENERRKHEIASHKLEQQENFKNLQRTSTSKLKIVHSLVIGYVERKKD